MATQPVVISNDDIHNAPSQTTTYSPADALANTNDSSPSSYTPDYQKGVGGPVDNNGDPIYSPLDGMSVAKEPSLAGHPNNIAYVSDYEHDDRGNIVKDAQGKPIVGDAPRTINVTDPSKFTQAVKVHEQTHIYQNSRNDDFIKELPKPTATKTYDYGGINGLEALRNSKGTINDLSVEKQARVQEDWTRYQAYYGNLASKGKLTQKKAQDYDRLKSAYGWAIGQLAGIPSQAEFDMNRIREKMLPGSDPSMDVTPKAPGSPPAAASGVITDIPEVSHRASVDQNYMNTQAGKPAQVQDDDVQNRPSAPKVALTDFGRPAPTASALPGMDENDIHNHPEDYKPVSKKKKQKGQ